MTAAKITSKQVFIIRSRTGCTCCSSQNHWRGPYKTRAAAERRIAYFLAPDSKFWPLSSQCAKRGHYKIFETKLEYLPDGRAIMRWEVLGTVPAFITVHKDGTVDSNGAERVGID